jgi:hypothetical protein
MPDEICGDDPILRYEAIAAPDDPGALGSAPRRGRPRLRNLKSEVLPHLPATVESGGKQERDDG